MERSAERVTSNNDHCINIHQIEYKKSDMSEVGFEPTHLSISELKSDALDRSAILTVVYPASDLLCILTERIVLFHSTNLLDNRIGSVLMGIER